MKKLIILFFALLLTGCARSVSLKSNEITNINFNGLTIIDENYSQISKFLNEIHFIETNYEGDYYHDLDIKTTEKLYSFKISNDYRMKYSIGDDEYYSNDKTDIKKLLNYLQEIDLLYRDETFYSIISTDNYSENSNDLIIKLDSTNNYFILNVDEKITNFKIHRIDYINENFEDVDLLYEISSVDANKKLVVRTTFPETVPNIRFSFDTKYNFTVSIIPSYNGRDGGFNYISTMTQK